MKSKFCLESVASFAQINQATTNQSPTKHTFTFSKGSRFELPKANCPLNTYGGESVTRNSRATALGYGNKVDFTRGLTVSPSADRYSLKSFWDQNLAKKKGPSFALSRDKVSFNTYLPIQKVLVPPATHYNNQVNNRKKAPMYSLRQKTTIVDKTGTLQPQNNNPGPGSYVNPQLQSHKSHKFISKYRNLSYSQPKSKRFGLSLSLAPGPGNYKEIQTLSKTGTYILSQNKGGTKAKFDQNKRQSLFDQIQRKQLCKPGPGYYKAPSEFGQYDGNVYTELRENRKRKNGWRIQTERIGKI